MSAFQQPGPWIQVESKKHEGRQYYSNTITNESQWEPPNGKDFISKSGEFITSRFMKYLSANPSIDLLEEGESQYRETGGTSPDFIQFVLDNASVVDMDINNLISITVNVIKTILERLGETPSELFSMVLFASGHGGSECISVFEHGKLSETTNVLTMPIVPPGKDGYNFTKIEGMNMAMAIAKKRGNLLTKEEKEPFRNRIIQQYRRVEREISESIDAMRLKISFIRYDITLAENVPEKIKKKEQNPNINTWYDPLKTMYDICKRNGMNCEGIDDPVNALINHLQSLIHELERQIQKENEKHALIREGIDSNFVAKVVNSSANMQILSSCTEKFANIMGLFVVKPSFEAKYPSYSRIIMIMLAEIDEIYRLTYKRDEIAINSLFKNEPRYKPNTTGMFYRLLDRFSQVYKGKELDVTKIIRRSELDPSLAILLIGNIFITQYPGFRIPSKMDIMYVNNCCRRTMPRPDPETIVGSPPKGGTRRRRVFGKKTRRRSYNKQK
jgi:hypothetical protein